MTSTIDGLLKLVAPDLGDDAEAASKRLVALQAELRDALRSVGRKCSPVKCSEIEALANHDSVFAADAQAFMDRMFSSIDVTDLNPGDDPERWERLNPKAPFYVKKLEAPRYEVRENEGVFVVYDVVLDDSETEYDPDDYEGEPDEARLEAEQEAREEVELLNKTDFYIVVDERESSQDPVENEVYTDKEDADDAAENENSEIDQEEELMAFPFAWNHGWEWRGGSLPSNWLAALTASGFLVYKLDEDRYIAGIDGAGYSFLMQHYAPLYARLAAENRWLIETKNGPRLVVQE